jgi:hypothetical protein
MHQKAQIANRTCFFFCIYPLTCCGTHMAQPYGSSMSNSCMKQNDIILLLKRIFKVDLLHMKLDTPYCNLFMELSPTQWRSVMFFCVCWSTSSSCIVYCWVLHKFLLLAKAHGCRWSLASRLQGMLLYFDH